MQKIQLQERVCDVFKRVKSTSIREKKLVNKMVSMQVKKLTPFDALVQCKTSVKPYSPQPKGKKV